MMAILKTLLKVLNFRRRLAIFRVGFLALVRIAYLILESQMEESCALVLAVTIAKQTNTFWQSNSPK